ncbi:MAG: beta-lactamase family protein [Spirochaetales bacterium]|nr:beta-lactamase family protein [Spirochaetales bacterium]
MENRLSLLLFVPVIMVVCMTCDILDDSGKNSPASQVNNPAHSANALYAGLMNKYTAKGIPGIAIGVDYPVEGTWIGVGGKADLSTGEDVQFDSIFNAAAVSHYFLCVITLQLIEELKLELTSKIWDYLTGEQQLYILDSYGVTIEQLMNHSSGLYDYSQDVEFVLAVMAHPGRKWKADDILPFVFGKKTDDGGWTIPYAATNDILLQICIETIEGKPLAQVVEERIVTPLGLTHTWFGYDSVKDGPVKSYLSFTEGEVVENTSILVGYYTGEAGVFSTVSDICVIFRDLLNGSAGHLLEDASLPLMPDIDGYIYTPSFTSWVDVESGDIHVVLYNAGLGSLGDLIGDEIDDEFW